MKRHVATILALIGVAVATVGMWSISFECGLVNVGLLLWLIGSNLRDARSPDDAAMTALAAAMTAHELATDAGTDIPVTSSDMPAYHPYYSAN